MLFGMKMETAVVFLLDGTNHALAAWKYYVHLCGEVSDPRIACQQPGPERTEVRGPAIGENHPTMFGFPTRENPSPSICRATRPTDSDNQAEGFWIRRLEVNSCCCHSGGSRESRRFLIVN